MPNLEMTQEQKFAARLKQLLSESGLHEIIVFVSADRTISFWVVKSDKVEGEKRDTITKNLTVFTNQLQPTVKADGEGGGKVLNTI